MKILSTGATGFLGKSVCNYFKNEHEFYNIPSEYINNLEELTFKSIKPIRYDALVHIGWGGASNNKDLNNSVQIENIKQSIDLFNFALNLGVKHFVFVSTSWVYGDYDAPCNENNICNPKNLYGFSKLKVEEIWKELSVVNNVKLTIVRPLWIFGKGDKENRFIPTIIKKCLKNENIELNSCEHFVNYLHISEFCSGFRILMNEQAEGIFNICSDSAQKVQIIVKEISRLTMSRSNITFNNPYPPNFVNYWHGDNIKLKSLGWKNSMTLTEGLEKTINSLHE